MGYVRLWVAGHGLFEDKGAGTTFISVPAFAAWAKLALQGLSPMVQLSPDPNVIHFYMGHSDFNQVNVLVMPKEALPDLLIDLVGLVKEMEDADEWNQARGRNAVQVYNN
jgi:hypothetical protein